MTSIFLITTIILFAFSLFISIRYYKLTQLNVAYLPHHIHHRSNINEILKPYLAAHHNTKTYNALIYVKATGIGSINNSHGYQAGDGIIDQIHKRLFYFNKKGFLIFQYSSHEYLFFSKNQFDQAALDESLDTIQSFFIPYLNQPYDIDGFENAILSFTAGANILDFSEHIDIDKEIHNTYKTMNYAMYKLNDSFAIYNDSIKNTAFLLKGLNQAISNNEIEIYYQPIVNFNSNKIVGSQVSVRWISPIYGSVPPLVFIPIAIDNDLIKPLTLHLFEQVLIQYTIWHNSPEFEDFKKISIKMSHKLIESIDFISALMNLFSKYSISPSVFDLEITDLQNTPNLQPFIQSLNLLKDLGFNLSLDGFGTGLSSFESIKNLPIKTIKVDKTFISEIPKNSNNSVISTSIVNMAKSLGFEIVVEGVENQDQFNFFQKLKCNNFIGYYKSEPINASEFFKLISNEYIKTKLFNQCF